jgi:hypothetical protein
MPCPYFEPLQTIATPELRNARLPLIEEYRGRCLSMATPLEAGGYQCNHGYARGLCVSFPDGKRSSAHRFSLLMCDAQQVEFLFIREEEYAPAATRLLHFCISEDNLVETDLDTAVRAQATAYCRSYLKTHRGPSC